MAAKFNKYAPRKTVKTKRVFHRANGTLDGAKGKVDCSITYNKETDRYSLKIGDKFVLSDVNFSACIFKAQRYNIDWKENETV